MSAVSGRLLPSGSHGTCWRTARASAPSGDDTNPVRRNATRRGQTLLLLRLRRLERPACTRLPVNDPRLAVPECRPSLWRLSTSSTTCLSTERDLLPTARLEWATFRCPGEPLPQTGGFVGEFELHKTQVGSSPETNAGALHRAGRQGVRRSAFRLDTSGMEKWKTKRGQAWLTFMTVGGFVTTS